METNLLNSKRLETLYNKNPIEWENRIDLISRKPDLVPKYPKSIVTGKVSEHHLKTILKLIRENKLDIDYVYGLADGKSLQRLSSMIISNFVLEMGDISDYAKWCAFDILSIYNFNQSNTDDVLTNTTKLLLEDLKLDKSKYPQGMYFWEIATKKILKNIQPSEGIQFAKKMTDNIVHATNLIFEFSDAAHIKSILRLLLMNYSNDVWQIIVDAIFSGKEEKQSWMRYILSPASGGQIDDDEFFASLVDAVQDEQLFDSCKKNPKLSFFIAEITDPFIDNGDTYQLSPRSLKMIDELVVSDENALPNREEFFNQLFTLPSGVVYRGSSNQTYKKELDALKTLQKHPSDYVRKLAQNKIKQLKEIMEKTSIERR